MTANEGAISAALNDIAPVLNKIPDPKKGELFPDEQLWAERHDYLLNRGYQLRPRYRPGWKASWKSVVPSPQHEDAIRLSIVGRIMDAERTSDGTFVMMKVVQRDSTELKITILLSTEGAPHNHTVPLMDILDDPLDPESCIMVLPLLRDSRQPPLTSVGDCVEFVEQTLEGIAFFHERNVAHRDCFIGNILMDARALYPGGWHPQQQNRHRSGRLMSDSWQPKRRSVGGVHYYFIDFGISSLNQNEVTGTRGQLKAPELSDTVPYNPYKVDIWLLGQSYYHMITEKYRGVEWIKSLITAMTDGNPAARPDIKECIARFDGIKATITPLTRAKRLHPQTPEWKLVQLGRDATYLVSAGIWALKLWKKPLQPYLPMDNKNVPPSILRHYSTSEDVTVAIPTSGAEHQRTVSGQEPVVSG
ncbi:hypothetical protein FRC02_002590 [Tulasnella sp. 418]|nr:hypothetical protein FRC02_002590 [Tulasnella sp. 418]